MKVKFFLCLFLLCGLSYGYFFQSGQWNENARFDQTRAIAELHTLHVDKFAYNTGDLIKFNNKMYPNKAPGASFLAVPFWWFWRCVFSIFDLPDEIALSWICYLVAWTTVGLVSALSVLALFIVAECMLRNRTRSLFLALGYAFGTLAFPYSTMFFSHQLAASLLIISFALLFCYKQKTSPFPWLAHFAAKRYLFLSGLCAGYAVTTDYPNALGAFFITGYASFATRKIKPFLAYLAGLFLGVAPLLAYHLVAFGKVEQLPYFSYTAGRTPDQIANVAKPPNRVSQLGLRLPSFAVFIEVAFKPLRGLFYINPWLLGLFFGWIPAMKLKKWRLEIITCLLLVASYFVYNASCGRTVFTWGGGYAVGPRYLVPAIPFAVVSLALLTQIRITRWLLYVLGLFSVCAMVMATAVEPRVPFHYSNPLVQFYWPYYLIGRYAISSMGIFYPTLLTNDSTAFNFGKIIGLIPSLQLIPLFGLWVYFLRRLDDRQPQGSSSLFRITILCLGLFFLLPVAHAGYQRYLDKSVGGLEAVYLPGYRFPAPEPVYTPAKIDPVQFQTRTRDQDLNFRWLTEGTPIRGLFSAEWTGYLYVPKKSSYTFELWSDDGSSLYLDEKLIINHWTERATYPLSASVVLDKGWRPIAVRYYQAGGGADLRLLWAETGKKLQPISGKSFRRHIEQL